MYASKWNLGCLRQLERRDRLLPKASSIGIADKLRSRRRHAVDHDPTNIIGPWRVLKYFIIWSTLARPRRGDERAVWWYRHGEQGYAAETPSPLVAGRHPRCLLAAEPHARELPHLFMGVIYISWTSQGLNSFLQQYLSPSMKLAILIPFSFGFSLKAGRR